MQGVLSPHRIAALAAIVLLIVVGFTLVHDAATTPEQGETRSWGAYGGAGDAQLPLFVTETPETPDYSQGLAALTPRTSVSFSPGFPQATELPTENPSVMPADTDTSPQEGTAPREEADAYLSLSSWVDSLFSFSFGSSDTTSAPQRSALQQSLYAYGNAAGKPLQAFEAAHPTLVEDLETFVEGRTDETATPVLALADAYHDLADALEAIDAPDEISGPHQALISAYRDASAGFETIAAARSDTELQASITAYTTAVTAHADAFARIAFFLQTYGIEYADAEPGSVFTVSL